MQNKQTIEFLKKLKDSGNWSKECDYSKVDYVSRDCFVTVIDGFGFEHKINSRGLLNGVKCSIKTAIEKSKYYINNAKIIHGNKYDYSLVNYKNTDTKVKIVCPEHGEFSQNPSDHLAGNGCTLCAKQKQKLPKLKSDDFIKKAKQKHGDRYDYSLVEYAGAKNKVKIICSEHGVFEQAPTNHLSGAGCSACGGSKQLTTVDFIERAKKKHGDKYDYSLVNYVDINTEVEIMCPAHGNFKQTPQGHLSGPGCYKCSPKYKPTTDEFIEKAKLVHGDKYDYSLVNYKNISDKVKIIDEYGIEHLVIPHIHLKGSSLSLKSAINKTALYVLKAKQKHGDRYDYSLVNYNGTKSKIKIICPEHGVFEQSSQNHLQGNQCPNCVGGVINLNTETFIEKAKQIHGDEYDYSLVNYKNSKSTVIITDKNNISYEILSANFLNGVKPNSLHIIDKTSFFIEKAKLIHGDKYDYSLVDYKSSKDKIKIICPTHGIFEQTYNHHITRKQGCQICNHGFYNKHKLMLINQLEASDLFTMDPFEIYTIIGQGKLPIDFGTLANSDAGSEERLTTLQELKDKFSTEDEDIQQEPVEGMEDESILSETEELNALDEVDVEITNTTTQEEERPVLPHVNVLGDLHSLDNSIYATMDKEAFESLVQYKLRKLWNNVLNGNVTVDKIKADIGGEYFTQIKNLFLEEYEEVISYQPKPGYNFQHQPNLMQKLTVIRLLKNKSYGNWSGTGAGKTLSFIVTSREIDAKLTVIIALNSTIDQTCKVIKSVYSNSEVFDDYKKGQVFNRNKNNYLVLNYEKFQQEYSEELFQDLTNNNQIDFVVIDEVHNAKQRQEDEESLRRGVLNRLLGRIRANNKDLYTLVMSATPVVNNLYEAKSLLQLLTGLDYNDIDTRRTLPNALKIFQQLILNGLRFIPKYDIEINELTGSNMTNLNIDGAHLLDTILNLPQSNYIAIEKLLLEDKLEAIKSYLRKGVIVYSYLTTGFIKPIEKFVKKAGFSVGTYTGEESTFIRQDNLRKFLSGEIDILIGSRPIGTGVDGLQTVCDRMIPITLPWTDSEYTQLKGRIYRQGSLFGAVEIVIPQVRINLEDGDFWSWDMQRLNVIKNKKTLADAAVDGIVPSRVLPRPETMFKKSQESLQKWKDRVNAGNLVEVKRNLLNIDLYPSIRDEQQRQARIQSELSEFNRKGKTTRSETMHREFTDNPDSWFRYHALRKERMSDWDEIPYEYIATKIRNKNRKVADFGCGENLFKDCVPHNEVISFDHISHNGSIACDMKDVSQWLGDESIDIAVFSLALWGTNYKDYIKEAYRVLSYDGKIYIAEPAKDYSEEGSEKELVDLITGIGFKMVGDIERRGKFIYITGTKE